MVNTLQQMNEKKLNGTQWNGMAQQSLNIIIIIIIIVVSLINGGCEMDAQCLSGARCIENVCLCGPESISLFNPSTKVHYCHPKRK